MEKEIIAKTMRSLIEMLIQGHFDLIFDLDYMKSISINDVRDEIQAFPGHLSMPPDDNFQNLDIYETDFINQLLIDFPLWFDHLESDLTLQCRIFDVGEEQYRYSIEDIHVL